MIRNNNPDAIIINKEYRFRNRDSFDSLDAQVEASQAFQEFHAVQQILSPYFQGSFASYIVADQKGEQALSLIEDGRNAVRHCSVKGDSGLYHVVADWTFFRQVRHPEKLSYAALSMSLAPSSVPFFDEIATALGSVSQLYLPNGVRYGGGVSLVKNGHPRNFRQAGDTFGQIQ